MDTTSTTHTFIKFARTIVLVDLDLMIFWTASSSTHVPVLIYMYR